VTSHDSNKEGVFDLAHFEWLFREHFKALVAFSYQFVKDQDSAKEIVHDVFIRLWEKRDTIDPDRPIKSYLFTSVHNRSLNFIRDNKKFSNNPADLDALMESPEDEEQNLRDEEELVKKIHEAIDQLPLKCKNIFIMSKFQEMKYMEIAEELDISVKTVETQISKALKTLRKELGHLDSLILILILFF